MSKFVAVLGLVILVAEGLCTDINGTKINGETLPIQQVPYLVQIRASNRFVCTGSIISANFVLTAAVCVIGDMPNYKYEVRSGSAMEYISVGVKRIIIHDDFERKGIAVNDLALLELTLPLEFGETRTKIQLSDEDVPAGTFVTTFGWGKSLNNLELPAKLRAVRAPIISRDECQNIYGDHQQITGNLICAGYAGDELGVSGSPLVFNNAQVGLLSWSRTDGKSPDVYAFIPSYKSWIKKFVPDVL